MFWRCNLYDRPEETPVRWLPDDASPAEILATMPPIRQVEVRYYRLRPFGIHDVATEWVGRYGDHGFEITWTDHRGKHTQTFRATYDTVRTFWETRRVAGVFTEWGRIEVHIDPYRKPHVYVWTGVDTTPVKIKASRW